MPFFKSCPFEELVIRATNENNVHDDWATILEICDKAVNYEDGTKLILQSITKRLYHNVPRVVLQALLLLDACVKNCGRRFHLEVSSRNFTAEIRKLLQKMHPTTIDKFKGLIKKWAEVDFKDDSELGLIPSLYYKLKSEGIKFPEEKPEVKPAPPPCTNPDAVSTQQEEEDIVKAITLSLKETKQSSSTSGNIYDTKALYEPAKELLKVRALYDFEAVEDNELTIKAGEIIVVTDKSNESWWKGSNQRGEGYFPTSFVSENLDAEVLILKPVESEILNDNEENIIESPVVIDEEKIQKTLCLLSDIDPTEDIPDEQKLLEMERECYAMSPLIDEKLQEIDKKCTVLNALNKDIMKAIQTFYKLTRDSAMPFPDQYGYFYPADAMRLSLDPQFSMAQRHNVLPNGGAFYIPPHYLPNLANLASNQIKQNITNLSFAHPSDYNPGHFNTLPQKFCVDPRLNLPYMPNQQFMKSVNPEKNIENHNVVQSNNEQPIGSLNSTSSQNYPNVPQSNVTMMSSQTNPVTMSSNNATPCSTEQPPHQSFFTPAPTSGMVTVHSINEPNNVSNTMASNAYNSIHPDNSVPIVSDGPSDNIVNQTGSIL